MEITITIKTDGETDSPTVEKKKNYERELLARKVERENLRKESVAMNKDIEKITGLMKQIEEKRGIAFHLAYPDLQRVFHTVVLNGPVRPLVMVRILEDILDELRESLNEEKHA